MSVTFSAIEGESESVAWEPTQCTTISGSFAIYGLRKACRSGTGQRYHSPTIEGGTWQFEIDLHRELSASSDTARFVKLSLCMIGKPHSHRIHNHYEFTARAYAGDMQITEYTTASHRYAQGDSVQIDEFLSMRDVADMPELQSNDTIVIEYDISERPRDAHRHPLGLAPSYAALAHATAQIFDDPYTADVCFVIRNPSASHPRPRQLYAHARILCARSEYFARVLAHPPVSGQGQGQGGAENEEDDALDVSAAAAATDVTGAGEEDEDGGGADARWEGGSDSDWEDEDTDAEEDEAVTAAVAAATAAGADSLAVSAASTAPGDEEVGLYADDVTRVDFGASAAGRSTSGKAKPRHPAREDASPEPTDGEAEDEERDPAPGRKRRVVQVHDVSYRTYRAFLFFLYTGSIAFAPLRSTYRAERAAAVTEGVAFVTRDEFNLLHCTRVMAMDGFEDFWASAKSVYWLCDKYGAHELMHAAGQHIRESLSAANVADEVVSSFSRDYPDIRREQAAFLKEHWAEVSASEGFRRLFVRLFAASAGGPGVGEMWVDILSGLRVPASEEDGGREEKSAVEDDLFAPSESVL